NGWNELDYVRVQPPPSLGLEVRPWMLSEEKNNNPLKIIVVKYNETLTATEIYKERYIRTLPNEGNIYVGSPWETGKTYILEHHTISDDVNLLVLSIRYSYSNAVTTRLNLKSYCDID
ncbi:10480_t:CDS:2, partial [Funneliformis geosporum]